MVLPSAQLSLYFHFVLIVYLAQFYRSWEEKETWSVTRKLDQVNWMHATTFFIPMDNSIIQDLDVSSKFGDFERTA